MFFEPFSDVRDRAFVGIWRRMRPVKNPDFAEQEHTDT